MARRMIIQPQGATAAFWAAFALRVQRNERIHGDDAARMAGRAFSYAENAGIVLQ